MTTANKRLPTQSSLSTAQKNQINKEAVKKSVGYNTDLKIDNRPVTQQGLEGLKSKKSLGPGRQIHDKYYYINLLKKKTTEIVNENNNLRNEIGTINSDISTYNNLNKTYNTLLKDVQNLEGELADYNLASDKLRSNMRPEDIEAIYNHIKINNKKKRDESDILFLQKQKKDQELHELEFEINKIFQSMEQKLNELEPDQKQEYEQLREENQKCILKIQEFREELSRINYEINEAENVIKNNSSKREAHQLREQLSQLHKRKEELELQTNESGLSVEEIKQKLVNKYREDTSEKTNIDKKIGDIKKIIETYKKSISEIEKEIKSNMTSTETNKTQDSILAKNKEYSDFIDNFEDNKKAKVKELDNKEELIVAILENISEKIISKTNMPSKDQFKGLIADLDHKKNTVKNSMSTLEEAKLLYENLQVKMKRMDNLEENLKKEILSISEKLNLMKKDISEKFEKIEVEKENYRNEQKKYSEMIKYLEKVKNSYNKLLTPLILKSSAKSSQLEDLEYFKKLRDLEKKMQENDNHIQAISNYIESKSSEADMTHITKECLDYQNEINQELIKKTLSVKI